MRVAPDCRQSQTARHEQLPLTSTSHPPSNKKQSTVSCTQARGPATIAPLVTTPANNNRTEERLISCRQQPAPPPINAAKMSPRISISPEPVLAAHAPSPPATGSH